MNKILTSVLERQVVLTPEGNEETLHSNVDAQEVNFIANLIREFQCKKSLEVGCAMGVSSLAICESIEKNAPGSNHLIIDPYQSTYWKGIGIHQLNRAGLKNYQLMEMPSEFALPQLVQENQKFDFAFIDGWHTFDHTLIDFFYINRLLQPGGILVVDDVQLPAVKKVMRMIHTYPCYQVLGGVEVSYLKKVRVLEALKSAVRPAAKLMGKKISGEFMDASVLQSDRSLGLDCSVVAFQKIADDERPWNWFEPF